MYLCHVKQFMEVLDIKIQSHCRYYGITDNGAAVGNYIYECKKMLYKWLNRRSQRKGFYYWYCFNLFLDNIHCLDRKRIWESPITEQVAATYCKW